MGQVHFHDEGDACNERCVRVTRHGNVPLAGTSQDASTATQYCMGCLTGRHRGAHQGRCDCDCHRG